MESSPTSPLAGAAAYRRWWHTTFTGSSPPALAEGTAWEPLRGGSSSAHDEIALQSRWFAGEFGRTFVTEAGEPVEIVHFGCWNHAAGPDFTDAVVRVGGTKFRGAIEIDLDARGWELHGHSQNPAYNSVVLHLVCTLPAGGTFFTRTEDHQNLPQVVLGEPETPGLPHPAYLPEAKLGRCSHPLREMGPTRVESLLRAAAQHRLDLKARRFRRAEEAHGWKQALFQGIAEALGYKNNKLPLRVLAQRLPIATLRGADERDAEALVFGVAGFLEGSSFDDSGDPTTRDYLRSLWESWWKHRAALSPDPRATPPWNLAGARPTNHPQRRLGALAALVARWPELVRLADPDSPLDPRALLRFFSSLRHPYWDAHYTLKSRAAAKPMALVGRARAGDILTNWIFPFRIAYAPDLWDAYAALPATLDNQASRRAALRLLGDHPDTARLTQKAFHLQGLQQIYQDFCLVDDSDCDDCPFPEQLGNWLL